MVRARRTTPQGYKHARALRRNMTPYERKLWARLRGGQIEGLRFRRQHAIGNTIVDFCAIREKLIIEIDGSHHTEQAEYDEGRTEFLESQGYRVLRFWNSQVERELDGVIQVIRSAIKENRRAA